ncbi:MAG: GNAT family N-acetyltransferase, partial [Candidatus Helarchaeota archaeon]|nr:GNAT family N-acetyltransferase [Candidatus Helarchaeota archaeon]
MKLRVYTLNSRNGLKSDAKNELLRYVFRVRYRVYHDEMGVIPENPERELYDEYDFIEPTSIFLAIDGSKPVGTMRLTRYSERYKLPIFKNFENELKNMFNIHGRIREGRKFAEASRFTVLEDYRLGRSCVPAILTCMMYDRCVEDGITDLMIVANPGQQKLYENAGFEVFGVKKELLTG